MGFESGMTTAQKKRDLAERMIQRIVADEDFRRDIVDDPRAAMMEAGFVEDHDQLVDEVADTPEAQAFAAFGFGLQKLGEVEEDAVVYPTWVLGPTCSSAPQG